MLLAACAVVAGLMLGRAAGGRFRRLAGLPLRSIWLLGAAVAAQLAGALLAAVSPAGYPAGLALSAVAVTVFLARNRRVRGLGLIALGLLANALAIGANAGRMPVSDAAAARAGLAVLPLAEDSRHSESGPTTRLRALTDVIPVALPGRPSVVSAGDLLVAAGAGLLVVSGMRRPPRPSPPPTGPVAEMAPPPPPQIPTADRAAPGPQVAPGAADPAAPAASADPPAATAPPADRRDTPDISSSATRQGPGPGAQFGT